MLRNVKVGDKLWCVWNRRNDEEVVVTKVGRKWITFGEHGVQRAEIETGLIDNGVYSSTGRLYLSKEVYDEQRQLNNLWFDFSRRIPNRRADGVTEQAIREAAVLLGIKLEV